MTAVPLSDVRRAKARFARSVNVERDLESSAIDGYLPVGRAIDVLARFAAALDRDDVEVAFSITGPYGSGKSSLAVVLDALLGPSSSGSRRTAEGILHDVAPEVLARLSSARRRLGAEKSGFVRAVVTAQREPILTTVLRALESGAARFDPGSRGLPQLRALRTEISELLSGALGQRAERPSSRDVRSVIARLGEFAPVLLLIDEFGKNLEAFADSRSDADLFLLQDLAEWSRGGDGIPLALVTLQHLAFDEYADTASSTQRREWSKIQGRFEDIAFIDSPTQTRSLIAAAFAEVPKRFRHRVLAWGAKQASAIGDAGLEDLGRQPELLAACWPLHPTALAVLPDLCQRYGQNERTLFSFLAGHEPLGVGVFLDEGILGDSELPSVRLDRLYDYFIESAANMASVSANASRWVEIDLRVRDATTIDDSARRVLKAIGVLNLVSAGGALRANAQLLAAAMADGSLGTEDAVAVRDRIAELESAGLVTFRSFVDEYRIWQGSDFDLKSALELARRRVRDNSVDNLLNATLPLTPIIAGRHSYETGTLRAFERRWVNANTTEIVPLGIDDLFDGSALYVVGSDAPVSTVIPFVNSKPIVFATADDPTPVVDAAVEVAALDDVLHGEGSIKDDWVAWRELRERRIEAHMRLRRAFFACYGDGEARWWAHLEGEWTSSKGMNSSQCISAISRETYSLAPVIKNDLMNRHELSSQAAKARRVLAEKMVRGQELESLGIEGFGPEKTLFLSLLAIHGLHVADGSTWAFTSPPLESSLRPTWDEMLRLIEANLEGRLRVDDLYHLLSAPPYGLRGGIVPIVLIALLLVENDQIALYEHGTFRPALGDDVLERLLKNPGNFELKHFGTRRGPRSMLIADFRNSLGIAESGIASTRTGGVLPVVSHLVQTVNLLPEYARRTKLLSPEAIAIRSAIRDATEPDVLLFESIPHALGANPIRPSGRGSSSDLKVLAEQAAAAMRDLTSAYAHLLAWIRQRLVESLGVRQQDLHAELRKRSESITSIVTDDRLQRLLVALKAEIPDEESWLAYVGMNVTGTPPEGWSDDDRTMFGNRLEELGQLFQRTYLLSADMSHLDDHRESARVIVTRSTGDESVHLIAADPLLSSSSKKALRTATREIMHGSRASRAEALEALVRAGLDELGR